MPNAHNAEVATWRGSVKKNFLNFFAKFTLKHLCHSLFLDEVAGISLNFIKKETMTQVLS